LQPSFREDKKLIATRAQSREDAQSKNKLYQFFLVTLCGLVALRYNLKFVFKNLVYCSYICRVIGFRTFGIKRESGDLPAEGRNSGAIPVAVKPLRKEKS